jgi:hypothetical protein
MESHDVASIFCQALLDERTVIVGVIRVRA